MPTVVNTELTAGVGQKLIKPVEAEDVADEIVDALEVPPLRRLGAARERRSSSSSSPCCRARWREAIGRLMKVDKLMTEVDHGARRAYEERAAAQRAGAASAEPDAEPPSATPPEPGRGFGRIARIRMGRIYDATWGRGFRGALRPRPEGDRRGRPAARCGASCWPERAGTDGRARRRHRRQPRALSRTRSTSWSWSSPTRTCSSGCGRSWRESGATPS